jgi:hypothetical protein
MYGNFSEHLAAPPAEPFAARRAEGKTLYFVTRKLKTPSVVKAVDSCVRRRIEVDGEVYWLVTAFTSHERAERLAARLTARSRTGREMMAFPCRAGWDLAMMALLLLMDEDTSLLIDWNTPSAKVKSVGEMLKRERESIGLPPW